MSAYDAIDTTQYVDHTLYSNIVQAIADKPTLRHTLEKAVAKDGAYAGLVNTFDLESALVDNQLLDLEERLQ